MIKNIVFDIGNVLVHFKPEEHLQKFNYEKHIAEEVIKNIFKSSYWQDLDRGTLSEEEAVKIFCDNSPEVNKEIKEVMSSWMDMLIPMEESIEIYKELYKRGYNIYLLSNYHRNSFKEIYEKYDFFKLAKGKVVSYEINYLKPEKEIYEHLLKTYDLNPEETLFIDDTKINLEGAENLGISTILFRDAATLKEELKELRIL